jgi:hypothetical protein
LGHLAVVELAASRTNVDAFLVLKNGDVVFTPNFPKLA